MTTTLDLAQATEIAQRVHDAAKAFSDAAMDARAAGLEVEVGFDKHESGNLNGIFADVLLPLGKSAVTIER